MATPRALRSRTFASIALGICLTAILLILAVLQYRWSGELSRAELARMQSGLQSSAAQFRMQFSDAIQKIIQNFQNEETLRQGQGGREYSEPGNLIPEEIAPWVRDIYLWRLQKAGSDGLHRWNGRAKTFETADWPSALEKWRDRWRGPLDEKTFQRPELRLGSWWIGLEIPLLWHPLRIAMPEPGFPQPESAAREVLLIPLRLDALRSDLFPALVERCFGTGESLLYRIAIQGGDANGEIIYSSDPKVTKDVFTDADLRIPLLGEPRPGLGEPPRMQPGPRGGPPPEQMPPFDGGRGWPGAGRAGPGQRGNVLPAPGGRGFAPLMVSGSTSNWYLVAKHREGSLEVAVAGHRRRNLAVGFGILLLLGISMGFVVVSARRTKALARMQMDFVTRVSHELRTPLTVICSAADNLAEGIVDDSGRQVRQYGDLIRSEGRKLSGMVEQIMRFASLKKGWKHYNLRECRVTDIVESSLQQAKGVIQSAGFVVEKSLGENLPAVLVDAAVLSQCLQNLIDNALKYSGNSRWLGVRAERYSDPNGEGVTLSISDRGIGIAPDELKSVFGGFYRGKEADRKQIRGTGLGLYMVREAVVSMGGRISVDSSPGKGTTFTIDLPGIRS